MAAATAAASGATTAATATEIGQGNGWLQKESHVADIDVHALSLFKQVVIDAEGKAACFKELIVFGSFVKGEGKMRSAASPGSKIDADAAFRAVFEEFFEFFLGTLRKGNHADLLAVSSGYFACRTWEGVYLPAALHRNVA